MKADIPVLVDTDILISGTTSAAVSVALTARKAGKRVTCGRSLTYPGEDIYSTISYYNWGSCEIEAPS